MAYKATNNAYSTLAGTVSNVATTLTVQAGHGDRFPQITAPDYTYVTLEDASGNREIVKVTARAAASDTMTITRAQEGTTARNFGAGDSVECRLTAGIVEAAIGHPDDPTAAHAASAISFSPTGGLGSTDVQAALNELDSEKQAADAELSAIAGLTSAADRLAYFTGLGTAALAVFTSAARTLVAAVDAAAQRTALGLGALATKATVGTGDIDADSVTYAKMQNVSATSRALGRKTSGAGDVEELTLSELLDFIGSAAQGDILYRDASAWARLGAGTSGQFLKTLGAGANPAWASVNGSTLGTAVASTSGTSIDFTSIPSWVNWIIVSFIGVSTNGSSIPIVQIGDAGGVETSGYSGITAAGAGTTASFSAGFQLLTAWAAASTMQGHVILARENTASTTWTMTANIAVPAAANIYNAAGSKTLSQALDRIRITTAGGTDAFDAGEINILMG